MPTKLSQVLNTTKEKCSQAGTQSILRAIMPMIVVTIICLVVKEEYPFSHFPMYSKFDPKTDLLYITDKRGKALPIGPTFKQSASFLKKSWQRERNAIKSEIAKAQKKLNLKDEAKVEFEKRRGRAAQEIGGSKILARFLEYRNSFQNRDKKDAQAFPLPKDGLVLIKKNIYIAKDRKSFDYEEIKLAEINYKKDADGLYKLPANFKTDLQKLLDSYKKL